MRVANKLRALRTEGGFSLRALSSILTDAGAKVSYPAINHWEAGRSLPSASVLVAYADVFDLKLGPLVRLVVAEKRRAKV